jgi:hypothetical protein
MRYKHLLVAAFLGGAVTVAVAQSAMTLRYGGEIVSHNVRMLNGQPYVPVSDVAHLLKGQLARAGSGYEIRGGEAGGANQVKGLQGKIGQMLFTGKYRFKVTGVTVADHYDTQFQPKKETIKPDADSQEIVAVTCEVRNGTKKPVELKISIHAGSNTALTDDKDHAFPPHEYDLSNGGFYGPPKMLPGSAEQFAIIFQIPKNTNLKDLVFTLTSYGDDTPVDVRVSLKQ